MVSSGTECSIRIAGDDDCAAVRELDNVVFPENSPILQRAEPGELEVGIQTGDVSVLESIGRIVGYIFTDRSDPDCLYISGVAIHPEAQGRGFGGLMIDRALSDVRKPRPGCVVTVTSPGNTPMLRTLFRRGFAARWVFRDHFGPRRDRFGCQLRTGTEAERTGEVQWVPAVARDAVYRLIEEQHFYVRSLVVTTNGPQFCLTPTRNDDFPEVTSWPLLPGFCGLNPI